MDNLPVTELIQPAPGVSLYVLHNVRQLDVDPVAAGIAAVIFGHSHHASIALTAGVWYLNPGSAGPLGFLCPSR